MFLAPVFGYLGDRYDRKLIMIAGLIVWIVTTLASSFVKKSVEYFQFWISSNISVKSHNVNNMYMFQLVPILWPISLFYYHFNSVIILRTELNFVSSYIQYLSLFLLQQFWVLVLTRALVGTGEASYSTIAPTIIGDLFTGTKRTLMISFFYIFIPVGRWRPYCKIYIYKLIQIFHCLYVACLCLRVPDRL